METLTVTTTVNAPIEKVWKLWSNPRDIEQWNSPSDEWHTPAAENDLRTGGKFKSTMAARDGSASFDFEGEYTTVDHHKTIAYTITDGRKVKITFNDLGQNVHIIETFDAENVNPLELQQKGWQAIMDSFKRYAEQ